MTNPAFAARPQLSDDVARYVRRRIFQGAYSAGEYLRLDQLAAELGISVTPVREALLNLRAEGLLVQQPRRGFMVLPVTRRDIADVASVQAFIGGELAARAAENISEEQLAELRKIQGALEEAYARTDHERVVRLNHEFHRAINVAADSQKLTLKDHRRIVAAIAKRDPQRARIVMSEHFTVGVEPLTDHLVEMGVIADADRPAGESAAV